MSQCPCCSGTDVAHAMGDPCYAEEQQRQWDEDRRAEEEYEAARFEEAAEAAVAIGALALAVGIHIARATPSGIEAISPQDFFINPIREETPPSPSGGEAKAGDIEPLDEMPR